MKTSYAMQFGAVTTAAWEIYTNNGYQMDEEDQRGASQKVDAAAETAHTDGMTAAQWLAETLAYLEACREA